MQPAEGDDFVGREEYYRRLKRYLGENSSIIRLIGERGIGKTSFLRNLFVKEFPKQTLLFIEYRTEKLGKGFGIPELYESLDNKTKRLRDTATSLVKKLDNLEFKASLQGVPSLEIRKSPGAFSETTGLIEVNYKTIADIQKFLEGKKQKVEYKIERMESRLKELEKGSLTPQKLPAKGTDIDATTALEFKDPKRLMLSYYLPENYRLLMLAEAEAVWYDYVTADTQLNRILLALVHAYIWDEEVPEDVFTAEEGGESSPYARLMLHLYLSVRES